MSANREHRIFTISTPYLIQHPNRASTKYTLYEHNSDLTKPITIIELGSLYPDQAKLRISPALLEMPDEPVRSPTSPPEVPQQFLRRRGQPPKVPHNVYDERKHKESIDVFEQIWSAIIEKDEDEISPEITIHLPLQGIIQAACKNI